MREREGDEIPFAFIYCLMWDAFKRVVTFFCVDFSVSVNIESKEKKYWVEREIHFGVMEGSLKQFFVRIELNWNFQCSFKITKKSIKVGGSKNLNKCEIINGNETMLFFWKLLFLLHILSEFQQIIFEH